MSPKFNFKFDSVLKQKKHLEEREAKIFHSFHSAFTKESDKLKRLNSKYLNTQGKLARKKKKGIDITELKTYYTYMDSLKIDIKAQDLKVMEAEKMLEEQRNKLVKAQKDKKVIDKLKENKFNEYKELERKNEIKVLDDISSIKEARKRKSIK